VYSTHQKREHPYSPSVIQVLYETTLQARMHAVWNDWLECPRTPPTEHATASMLLWSVLWHVDLPSHHHLVSGPRLLGPRLSGHSPAALALSLSPVAFVATAAFYRAFA